MTTVAELMVVIGANASSLTSGLKDADARTQSFVQKTGAGLKTLGGQVTLFTAPLAAGLGAAVVQSIEFDNTMTNVGAVLGKSAEDMEDLNAQVLAMGGASLAGPQETANAFYDIVGGVADASTHMDILSQAIATSEAGQASLTGTTAALITAMNSYGFAATDAAFASDVMTQTVGKGVGSMDELAAALPKVTGLAASLGIEFDDLGGMMAYISTKGYSFAEAGTQIQAMMTALINPNQTMKDGLAELGYETGQAAIDALGLVGAYQALSTTQTATDNGMAKMTGSVEALNGVIALTDESAAGFLDGFVEGVDGATEAARTIQRESPAATFQLLASKGQEAAITIGNVLAPVLQDIADKIIPIVDGVIQWMNSNPQLAGTIVAVAAGALLLGPAITAVGFAMTGLSTAATLLSGPLGLVALGVAAVALTDWEGVNAGISTMGDGLEKLGSANLTTVAEGFREIGDGIGQATAASAPGQGADRIIEIIEGLVGTELPDVATGLSAWGDALGNAWLAGQIILDNVRRGLASFSLDIQLGIVNFAAGLRQQIMDITGVDIAPTIELTQMDLQFQRDVFDVAPLIEQELKANLAAGSINISDTIANTIQYGMAVDPTALAAGFSVTGKMAVEDALRAAFTISDQQTIDLLQPLAVALGIDVAALQADVTAQIQGVDYTTQVNAGLVVNPLISFLQDPASAIQNAVSGFGGFIQNLGAAVAPPGDVPALDVGTPFVQNDGLAMLHKGEAVLTAAENKALSAMANAGGRFAGMANDGGKAAQSTKHFNIVAYGTSTAKLAAMMARESALADL